MEKKEQGERYNEGKLRYDLLNPIAQEGLAKVLTKGSIKYAPRNWEKGMPWTSIVASLKRHLAAFEKGIDYDEETGLLHIDHIQCNAHFLSAYYKIAPHFDDRQHPYLKNKKIGLDIDEVLADFVGAYCKKYNIPEAKFWLFDRQMGDNFLKDLKEDKEFWLNLPVKTKPEDIGFEPHCYITSRSIPKEWTEEWLDINGFPGVPVYTVPFNTSKLKAIEESGIEIFVDDKYENFIEINKSGVLCYLFDAPHNHKYDVGFRRIGSLKDLT